VDYALNNTSTNYDVFNLLWEDCVFIAPSTVNQTVDLQTKFSIGSFAADKLLVEARVTLVGLRGGVNDPGAGFLGVKFQQGPPGVEQVSLGPLGYSCPFQVVDMYGAIA
jgi:hypothetical protein